MKDLLSVVRAQFYVVCRPFALYSIFASIAFKDVNYILHVTGHCFINVKNFTLEVVRVTFFSIFTKGTVRAITSENFMCSRSFLL